MDPAPTRYIQRDGRALAFQTVGNDGAPVVFLMESLLHLDLMWTDPHIHYNFERASRFARTVYVQRRGFGLSDAVDHIPTLEQQADDVLAVMDAAGMERAALLGYGSMCGPAALVAAAHPERVSELILILPFAERLLPAEPAPHGWTDAERAHFVDLSRSVGTHWGTGASLHWWAPDLDTPANRRLIALTERAAASPTAMQAHIEWMLSADYARVLPSIRCPTRIIHTADGPVPVAATTYVAEQIRSSTHHLLDRVDPGTSMGEMWLPIVDICEELITGSTLSIAADRHLVSLLFTDIVGSTEVLAQIGDSAYRELRAAHEHHIRHAVESVDGRLINVIGDGTVSLFDGPVAAVRCADRILDDAHTLGIQVRAGVHTGDVEESGGDIFGMAVHVGARIGSLAGADEILASHTVRDLAAGSGLTFTDRGFHCLRGVPGRWHLYAVDAAGAPPSVPRSAPRPGVLDRVALIAARRAPQAIRAAASLAHTRRRRHSGGYSPE